MLLNLASKQFFLFLFLTVKLPTIRLVLTQSSNRCLFCLWLFSPRFVKALLNRAHAVRSVSLVAQFVSSVLAALHRDLSQLTPGEAVCFPQMPLGSHVGIV